MANLVTASRYAPKTAGSSAPTPLADWGRSTIDTSKGGGYASQTYKYIWNGSTDAATKIKWGDNNVLLSGISGSGTSGQIYSSDFYNSSDTSHNVLWCVEWAPYSFGVSGISFDFVQKESSTGWGFGKMFLFYRYNGTGNSVVTEITPISGCKTGDGADFRFHRQNTATFDEVTNFQDHSYGTRSHLIAAGTDPGPNYLCVGWGGFYTLSKQANVKRNHGFSYNNFYLLPSGSVPTTDKWIGGICSTSNTTTKRHIYTS